MRKVEILERRFDPSDRTTGLKSTGKFATFHKWGVNFEEFDSGPGTYSTAIIEHPDGNVENIDCEFIKFVVNHD